MIKTLLIAKNDFEGLASAILLYQLHYSELDIKFYKYDAEIDSSELIGYDTVYSVGLKNAHTYIKDQKFIKLKSFDEVKANIKESKESLFNNPAFDDFCKHSAAYLDWSWREKQLYYGKNIDELSKYYNKVSLVQTISSRITRQQELVTDLERELIVFSKRIITDYINKKRYKVIEKGDKLIAYAFCEQNDIEFANRIMQEENVDIVVLLNMDKEIARIKTRNSKDIEPYILKAGGRVNSNGGTLKVPLKLVDVIYDLSFNELIRTLTGGGH